jgi:hypothetical protein
MASADDTIDEYERNIRGDWDKFEQDVRDAQSLGDYWDAAGGFIDSSTEHTGGLIDGLMELIGGYLIVF